MENCICALPQIQHDSKQTSFSESEVLSSFLQGKLPMGRAGSADGGTQLFRGFESLALRGLWTSFHITRAACPSSEPCCSSPSLHLSDSTNVTGHGGWRTLMAAPAQPRKGPFWQDAGLFPTCVECTVVLRSAALPSFGIYHIHLCGPLLFLFLYIFFAFQSLSCLLSRSLRSLPMPKALCSTYLVWVACPTCPYPYSIFVP